MPTPNFSGCKLDCCLPPFEWHVEQLITIFFIAAPLYTGRFLPCPLPFLHEANLHLSLIPDHILWTWFLCLPITPLWNNIPDGRETGTRRNVILDISLPCQAIPAQEGSSVGEVDPRTHVAKLSADYTEENKYSLFLEHFSPKWTKPVLPKSQSTPKML